MTRIPGRGIPALLALLYISMSGAPGASSQPRPTGADAAGLSFSDATAAAGLRFRHNSGAFGKKYLPETMGAGCAIFDADGDGWQDLLFVNGRHWPGRPGAKTYPALYRNNRNGTFTDITRSAGLAVEMYGLGAAAADVDNDGDNDLYLTALGGNRLFRNDGGKFIDVTAAAGVANGGFSTSALWFDYDEDGRVDLYVANYVEWSVDKDLFCTLDGRTKSYCTPESYRGQSGALYRNRGDGTFADVTRAAGVHDPTSKALGVALLDYNGDGRPDLAVANDTQPNRLYRHNGNGTFTDVGTTAGIAFSEAGVARAGMGIDAADYDGSGRDSLVIGNFSNEMLALYTNEGNGLFIDDAPTSAVGRASLLTLAFATFFFDADLDGRLDIFAANGHVADDINRVQPKVTHAQPPHLFRNLGQKRFQPLDALVGPAFQQPMVARGAAYGDLDRDGDLDLVITANNGPARLLRNDRRNGNRVLRVQLTGGPANRSAIGARARVLFDRGASAWAMVKTGSSYLSQSELPLTFGVAADRSPRAVEIVWPGRRAESVPVNGANQMVTIQQGKGIIQTTPLAGAGGR